ncbi:MAG: ATP synthase F1 subunit epsilon [Lachnospiraceae bacterium]|nr:ATP synthase F1 subunit epsilon [Lachnospiraceae bacterium]
MNTFTLKIIACDKVFYEGECEVMVFPSVDGEMAILANHEGFTTVTEIGEVKFRIPGEENYRVVIASDGILRVDNNIVELITYSAERPEDIDTFRAQAALERAQEQMRQKQSIMEYHISSASLARAMARLSGADKHR